MTTQSDDAKRIEQLRKERSEFFPPPRSVGDSVVTAFVLENLSSFKKFVDDKPKSLQVSAHRWVRDSLEEVRRSRMHSESANHLSLPNSFSDIPEVLEWNQMLKQEAELSSRKLVSASKNQRS